MSDNLNEFGYFSYKLPINEGELTNYISQLATHQVHYDALVLDARLRQSLVAVRSFGSRGLKVATIGTSKGLPTFASRWCQHAFVCPADEGAEAYITYLEQLLDQIGARVLITSSDATVALIRRHRERLERRVRIALAKEPALGIATDKEQTLEIAKRLGLGIPQAVVVEKVSEVSAALCEIGLPAVVKPVESWVWDKQQGVGLACKLVVTPDEARCAVEELTCPGGKTLFQQFLPGRREAVSLMYANGQIYASFAQWAKRTLPPLGGQSVLRQSIPLPSDVGNQAERLVREIELEGYSEVEFRRDSAGNPYLMEINPRLSASVELAVRAGVDFPYLLYQWANGDQINEVKSYHVGGWMRYLEGDLMTTIVALQQRGRPGVSSPTKAIFDFCVSFFIPAKYDFFDWRDPHPAYVAMRSITHYISQLIRKGLSKRKNH